MRADRLLSLMLLLQKHKRITAQELADRLGVSERTIYRDMDALGLAGIPVYTRPGPDGGCFLAERYRSSLNWFTGAELQTLLYTGSASPLSDLGMQEAMDNALLKLLANLPQRQRRAADLMQQRLYLDPTGWYGTRDDHLHLLTLKEAVWQDKIIEIQYTTWDGTQKQHILQPYSLVYKSDRWYLVAKRDRTMRTYRVSRIADVRVTMQSFERDHTFEVAAYWAQASRQFQQRVPAYPVILRVSPALMTYFQTMMVGRYEVLEAHETYLLLHVQYTVFEEARTSVLGLGSDVDVISPDELQQAVIQYARAIVTKFDGR